MCGRRCQWFLLVFLVYSGSLVSVDVRLRTEASSICLIKTQYTLMILHVNCIRQNLSVWCVCVDVSYLMSSLSVSSVLLSDLSVYVCVCFCDK